MNYAGFLALTVHYLTILLFFFLVKLNLYENKLTFFSYCYRMKIPTALVLRVQNGH